VRVKTLEEVGGLREWRFVSFDWIGPENFGHLLWYKESDPLVIAYWRGKLENAPPVIWYGTPDFIDEISFRLVLRPMLICVGGAAA